MLLNLHFLVFFQSIVCVITRKPFDQSDNILSNGCSGLASQSERTKLQPDLLKPTWFWGPSTWPTSGWILFHFPGSVLWRQDQAGQVKVSKMSHFLLCGTGFENMLECMKPILQNSENLLQMNVQRCICQLFVLTFLTVWLKSWPS